MDKLQNAQNKYYEILNKQKNNRKKYTLIDTGKEIIETINAKLLPHFNGYKDPYISLNLKYIRLICDLDSTNQNLTESYELWDKIVHNTNPIDPDNIFFNTYYYNRLHKLNEYIAYDLKKFVDEILSTICVIKNKIQNNRLSISSIGDYLNNHDMSFNEFDNFIDFFTTLNDLINSYKHSYANTDFHAYGRNENCFIALYSKNNAFKKESRPYCVSVSQMITEFNNFYKTSFHLIDVLTKNKLQ